MSFRRELARTQKTHYITIHRQPTFQPAKPFKNQFSAVVRVRVNAGHYVPPPVFRLCSSPTWILVPKVTYYVLSGTLNPTHSPPPGFKCQALITLLQCYFDHWFSVIRLVCPVGGWTGIKYARNIFVLCCLKVAAKHLAFNALSLNSRLSRGLSF